MKFKLVLAFLFAFSIFGFSQTPPSIPKPQPQDTALADLLSIQESLKKDTALQQGISNYTESLYSGIIPTAASILNTPLPSFSLKTLKGKKITSADLRGKVTFFYTWDPECEDCPAEIPDLNRLQNAFQGQDVIFLSLPIAQTEVLKHYLKQHPFNFQHILNPLSLIQQISLVPQNILVDRHGIIRYIINNPYDNLFDAKPINFQLLQEQIQSLLIE